MGVKEASREPRGYLAWALLPSPVIAWAVGLWLWPGEHGDLSDYVVLFTLLPAALAVATGTVFGRSLRQGVRPALGAAAICLGGFLLFVLVVGVSFRNDPPGF